PGLPTTGPRHRGHLRENHAPATSPSQQCDTRGGHVTCRSARGCQGTGQRGPAARAPSAADRLSVRDGLAAVAVLAAGAAVLAAGAAVLAAGAAVLAAGAAVLAAGAGFRSSSSRRRDGSSRTAASAPMPNSTADTA